jgi:serine/threonine-protein kinase HipA
MAFLMGCHMGKIAEYDINDAHLKNFGLLYTTEGFRLAPFYDVVAAALYPEYQGSLALRLGAGENPRDLASLGPKHLSALTESFKLSPNALKLAVADLSRRLPVAVRAIEESAQGSRALKEKLIVFMRKRWNGTFNSIGKQSRKRRDDDGRREA